MRFEAYENALEAYGRAKRLLGDDSPVTKRRKAELNRLSFGRIQRARPLRHPRPIPRHLRPILGRPDGK